MRTILDAAVGLVSYVDRDGRFRVVNRNYEQWFRRPLAEFAGQTVESALGPVTYARLKPRVDAALRGELVEFESHVLYPAGPRWSNARYVPDFAPDGSVRGFVAYINDVTERREAADLAAVQGERLSILAELSAQLLADRNPARATETCFPRAATHVGAEMFFHLLAREPERCLQLVASAGVSEHVAQSLARLQFGEAVCGHVAATKEAMIIAHVQQADSPLTELIKPLGVRAYACFPLMHETRLIGTWSVASVSRDYFHRDELDFLAHVARTASIGLARAQAEEQLSSAKDALDMEVRRRTARLEEAVRELEGFSYSITHDMRAPLRAMQNFALILDTEASAGLAPEHRDYLRRIVASARRLDHLIRDTLAYAKILRAELVLEPVDVVALLRDIVETYPDLQPHQERIGIAPEIPCVLANEAALTQCLANFLSNAVKFVVPGRPPQVRLWAEVRDGRVRIFCEDDGIGIPPEHAERIFALFQRLDHRYEGAGMGLSIARKAAERMGGSIGFERATGGGSRFWVELQEAP